MHRAKGDRLVRASGLPVRQCSGVSKVNGIYVYIRLFGYPNNPFILGPPFYATKGTLGGI